MKYFALLFLIITIFSSCREEISTPNSEFVENTYFGNCFLGFTEDRDEIVIRTEKEYSDYTDKIRVSSLGSDCEDAVPTDLDFSEHSLIGTLTSGGCSATYDRSLEENGNEITYKIRAEYRGLCLSLITSMNWALIPKLRKSEIVIFEVEEVDMN